MSREPAQPALAEITRILNDESESPAMRENARIALENAVPGTPAYSDHTYRARRALTPRERDILCRVLSQLLRFATNEKDEFFRHFTLEAGDGMTLQLVREALDPRRGEW